MIKIKCGGYRALTNLEPKSNDFTLRAIHSNLDTHKIQLVMVHTYILNIQNPLQNEISRSM